MEQKLHVRIAHAWNELRHVIDGAYAAYADDATMYTLRGALRGFASGIEERDRLAELLVEELGQEIRHRRLLGITGKGPIRLKDGARLLVLHGILHGIEVDEAGRAPVAAQIFCVREAAHKALVLGWLIAPHARQVYPAWIAKVRELPTYSQATGAVD